MYNDRQAKRSNVSIDGCLFNGCYASQKGGGINQDVEKMSVMSSVFYNNVAGSNNVAGGESYNGQRVSSFVKVGRGERVVLQAATRC